MTLFRAIACIIAVSLAAAIAATAATLTTGGANNHSGAPYRELDLSNYALTFHDDFKSLDISGQKGAHKRWYAHTPWNGDFGDARFSDPEDGPFSLTPEGLRITARKGADGHWRSGLISSRDHDGFEGDGFAQKYGYFEMKAKLPAGDGVWPAFWLIGVDKRISASEIDVMEYYGRFPKYYHATTHIWRKTSQDFDNITIEVENDSLTKNYNTYGVLIESDITTFYLNRRPVAAVKTPPEYQQPFYILANLALGGGWPISRLNGDQFMDISYIQVFKKREAPPEKQH